MILPKPEDAVHKAWLFRVLTEILDNSILSQSVYFKGGTAAAMLGFLDRFSIDLDFDLKKNTNKKILDKQLMQIFSHLDISVKQKSRRSLFYILKYRPSTNLRNTLKLSLVDSALKSNVYQPFYLQEIDRYSSCQTKETMFSNKLVAVIDRYQKYRSIAGRDIYDVHYFFMHGCRYLPAVIKERTGKNAPSYLKELKGFIEKKVTDRIISEDLSFLLSYEKFLSVKKILKKETLMFLGDEIKRSSI